MYSRSLFLAAIMVVSIGVFMFNTGIVASGEPQIVLITVSQLQQQPPIGLIGKPLGSRVIVEGVVGRAMMANPFSIARVDNKALPQPVLLDIRGIKPLKPGIRYKFEGYETGEFSGVPGWAASIQDQCIFGYRGLFVVTRTIEPVK